MESTTPKELKELEELSRPIMKWLNENFHPHVLVIIDPTRAQLVEGRCSTGDIMDYVKD
jgi:hypothetical protein